MLQNDIFFILALLAFSVVSNASADDPRNVLDTRSIDQSFLAVKPSSQEGPSDSTWWAVLEDPFGIGTVLPAVDGPKEFFDPFSAQFTYGSAGVQRYRFGWYTYEDFSYLPRAPASVGGSFQSLEWNGWARYSRPVNEHLVLAWTPIFNSKFWTGPSGIDLPPDADQLASDFLLASANPGQWNWQIGITPQVDSDFARTLTSNSLMCDVRGALLYRASSAWMLAMGAAYWNRANDRLIPYGGVIWTPDEHWEFRLLFPKSRISYYYGNRGGWDIWSYVSGEYDVEAFQIDPANPHSNLRAEMSDYELLVGLNAQCGNLSIFMEAGAVLDRHFRFRGPMPDFPVNDALMLRTGFYY